MREGRKVFGVGRRGREGRGGNEVMCKSQDRTIDIIVTSNQQKSKP